MLLFLDESYETDEAGGFRHALAGFGVDERQYRSLVAAVYQAKQHYFVAAGDMTPEEIAVARAHRFVTAEPPEHAEVKASKLLTEKQARHHALHGNAPGLFMAHDIMNALREVDAIVFGVLSRPGSIVEIQQKAPCLPVQFVRLLERINLWIEEQHPNGTAIIVPDTVSDGIDKHLSECMSDFLFQSTAGRRMRHIVTNPFWVDSRTTAGSQAADLIAHVLMNSMRPEASRKPLDELWRKVLALEFRSYDLETRGIRTVKRKQQAGAEAR